MAKTAGLKRTGVKAKPSIFIGSSSEQLRTAHKVKSLLQSNFSVDVWNEGVFGLGSSYLEDLLKAVETYDFAVFVFSPDDLTTMRGKRKPSVRDNVVFELGLFMGRLGRHRAFWLVPRGKAQPKIPSDLEGISRADFDNSPTKRSETLAIACRKITDAARTQGPRADANYEEIETPRVLCVASRQWAEFGFEDDVAALRAAFGKRVTVKPNLESNAALGELLTSGGDWPIVHLVCYVEPLRGDLIFSAVDVSRSPVISVPPNAARLSPDALADLCERAKVQLLVLATCESATYVQRLSRSTRVVASPTQVTGSAVGEWARLFYKQLAEGKALTQAFYTAQSVTNIPLLLTTGKKDLRVRA